MTVFVRVQCVPRARTEERITRSYNNARILRGGFTVVAIVLLFSFLAYHLSSLPPSARPGAASPRALPISLWRYAITLGLFLIRTFLAIAIASYASKVTARFTGFGHRQLFR